MKFVLIIKRHGAQNLQAGKITYVYVYKYSHILGRNSEYIKLEVYSLTLEQLLSRLLKKCA